MPWSRVVAGKRLVLALVVPLALLASSQDTKPAQEAKTWRGMWIATAGRRTFHGRWWASMNSGSHNAASGSWTLLSDSNQIVL